MKAIDFKADRATICHVSSSDFKKWHDKFNVVNVTFVGDLDNNSAIILSEKGDDIVATIDGNSTYSLTLTEAISVKSVTYNRSFTDDGGAYTIMLPFEFNASDANGTFYTLKSIGADENDPTIGIATPSSAVDKVEANKPYIFMPGENATFSKMTFSDVTLEATTSESLTLTNDCENTNWKLHGVYDKKVWTADNGNEYGFAAVANDDVAAGEFVHFVTGATLKATRCYLEYSKDGFTKSTPVLPERIIVVFPDETTSVVELGDPDDNGELTTPVSEITPKSAAKVWSYDKKIIIESQAGYQYRIIDLSGRTLRESRLAADREEVTLSRAAGIVIVVVNGESFKIKY